MFDTTRAKCVVRVFREGLLATVGHDLLLVVKDFQVTIKEDQSVEAKCTTGSIEVVGAVKNGVVIQRALSADDLRMIKRDIDKKVLETQRYPKATFRSTSVTETRIFGFLTLHGSEQRVEATVERTAGEAIAKLTVRQQSFGIKPYS